MATKPQKAKVKKGRSNPLKEQPPDPRYTTPGPYDRAMRKEK